MELKEILSNLDKSNKALVDRLRNYSSTKEIFETLNHPEQTGLGRLHKLDLKFFESNFDTVAEMYKVMSGNCVNFDDRYVFWYRGVLTSTNESDYWDRVDYYKLEIIYQYAKENNFQNENFFRAMSELYKNKKKF
ncbi:hypothetical protein [Lactobacillus taiwanensis]|uniref:hypothetical protein n=1 Tax=Lactobacillus taiwanensis TaxID=508451 RepID=UPI0025AA1F35|nr:hypothetical protein [Lactobacillus taiwanensis]